MRIKTEKLSMTKLFLLSGVIFSMHFGGASMIWPMTWGQESGESVLTAFSGIFVTALLFPLLAYIALSRGKGTFYQLSARVSDKFAMVFCGITMLVLGPLYAIPRMSAAAWDAFLQISGLNTSSMIPALIFSIIYYLVVYWFIAGKSDAVDKISKILFPVLIVAVVSIITKGLMFPLSHGVAKTYSEPAFAYGFVQGYATVELPCALVYATMIISDLKNRNLKGKSLDKTLACIGIVGIGMLTLTHLGHMLVGASTGALFSDVKYAAMYAKVVVTLWGTTGGIIFNIALLFAALTTAIGLAISTAEYFQVASEGRCGYKKSAIYVLMVSCIVSTIGLSNMVVFIAPLLDVIYPAAITLTLYYALIPNLYEKRRLLGSLRAGIIAAFIWGIYDGILGYMEMLHMNQGMLKAVHDAFPLAQYGLGWILITIICAIGGYLFTDHKKTRKVELQHQS